MVRQFNLLPICQRSQIIIRLRILVSRLKTRVRRASAHKQAIFRTGKMIMPVILLLLYVFFYMDFEEYKIK